MLQRLADLALVVACAFALAPVLARAGDEPANVALIRADFLARVAKDGDDASQCVVLWHADIGLLSFECSHKPFRCWAVPSPDVSDARVGIVGCEERAPGSSSERKS